MAEVKLNPETVPVTATYKIHRPKWAHLSVVRTDWLFTTDWDLSPHMCVNHSEGGILK